MTNMLNLDSKLFYEGCKALATSNDINDGNRLYIRLLYSVESLNTVIELSDKGLLSKYVKDYISTIDLGLLALERGARFRNLKRNLLRSFPLIEGYFEKDRFEQYLIKFINSIHFWEGKGRSLFENLAFFISNALDSMDSKKDMLKLMGVMSGISIKSNLNPPWDDLIIQKGTDMTIRNAVVCECFSSQYTLFSEEGDLIPPKELDSQKSENFVIIVVALFGNGVVKPYCINV